MASKKSSASKFTKETVRETVSPALSKVFTQAKESAMESLKILESLEKETKTQLLAAAKLVKLPTADERKKMTNDKIVASLKKLGLATQDQVDALEARIALLETKLATRASTKRTSSAETTPSASETPSAETL